MDQLDQGLYPSHFYDTITISLFQNQVPLYVLLSTDTQKTAVHIEKKMQISMVKLFDINFHHHLFGNQALKEIL